MNADQRLTEKLKANIAARKATGLSSVEYQKALAAEAAAKQVALQAALRRCLQAGMSGDAAEIDAAVAAYVAADNATK